MSRRDVLIAGFAAAVLTGLAVVVGFSRLLDEGERLTAAGAFLSKVRP